MNLTIDNDELDGSILPIFKPAGLTSFDVVKRVRHLTRIKKVGHAGTLDPFATGILIVAIGRSATRRLDEFQAMEKEYIGQVTLGIVTDTYDPTGKVLERNSFEMPDDLTINKILRTFEGDVEQLPPMFSAVKVGGMRMYRAARKGIELERKPRKVRISSIELIQMRKDGFDMKVVCSKGTYIRTLAYDVGRALGTGGHLSNLTRSRIGSITLDQTMSLETFAEWVKNVERGR